MKGYDIESKTNKRLNEKGKRFGFDPYKEKKIIPTKGPMSGQTKTIK